MLYIRLIKIRKVEMKFHLVMRKTFQYEIVSYHGGDYEKCRDEEPRLLQNVGEFLPDYT